MKELETRLSISAIIGLVPSLITVTALPVTISPVIAGLIFLLIFGRQSPVYFFLMKLGIKVVFSVPGIIIATVFVTFPFISRELIPVLEA